MSEGVRRTLKCLTCGAVMWQEGALPRACPACTAPWREPGVAIIQHPGDDQPDGASIIRDA